MEETTTIQCAHCFEEIALYLDITGGEEQEFVVDCEVCCRPMTIRLRIEPDGYTHVDVSSD